MSEPVDDNKFRLSQTETPEFKRWFRNSVVVNPDGSPMIVYHGTKKNFDTFTLNAETGSFGMHFGNVLQAHDFVNDERGHIMPVYLSIQRPLRLPDMMDWHYPEVRKALYDAGIACRDLRYAPPAVGVREYQRKWNARMVEYIMDAIESEGYDGIVYQNTHEGNEADDSWIVFHPWQIKSALSNRGRFDPRRPGISEQR